MAFSQRARAYTLNPTLPCPTLPLSPRALSDSSIIPAAGRLCLKLLFFLLCLASQYILRATQCKKPGVRSISGGLEHPQTPNGPFLETPNFRPSASTEGGCRSKWKGRVAGPGTPPTTSNRQKLHNLRTEGSGDSCLLCFYIGATSCSPVLVSALTRCWRERLL